MDVLVGTHRLLSRDVNPHDLGLVIIDEEQRFGVGHKEQMKNLRESIDVLTLSATPIPRTMQMSLSGVRDMSLILTPPDDRRPVEVHVGEWDPDVVSAAIRRELARGGQVYYVSNRVRSIEEAVRRVQAAAGEARVGVAHGQMDKDSLEKVMEEFSAGQLDVLVATTIIAVSYTHLDVYKRQGLCCHRGVICVMTIVRQFAQSTLFGWRNLAAINVE